MRSIEEFPDDQRPSLDQVLQQNSDVLERLLREGFFALEPEHSYFVYQLQVNDHVQTGVVAEVPLAEFQAGLIRQHDDLYGVADSILSFPSEISRKATQV